MQSGDPGAWRRKSFVIDGAPQIVRHGIEGHANLILAPLPVCECTDTIDPVAPDLGRENRTKSVPSEPDGLMADVDALFIQNSTTLRNDSRSRMSSITAKPVFSGEDVK